jgi:hypothetical protein
MGHREISAHQGGIPLPELNCGPHDWLTGRSAEHITHENEARTIASRRAYGTLRGAIARTLKAASAGVKLDLKAKDAGIVAVSATLSAIAAVAFWNAMSFKAPDSPDVPFPYEYLVAAVAFLGSLTASLIFVRKGAHTIRWAVGFILLADLFAALTYSITALVILAYGLIVGTTRANDPGIAIFVLLVGGPVLMPLMSLTVGNFLTRGIGFVMAVPALLWLLVIHRPSSPDTPVSERVNPMLSKL